MLIVLTCLGSVDANVSNAHGRTPLHEAAKTGDEQILKLLWKLKADANVLDKIS